MNNQKRRAQQWHEDEERPKRGNVKRAGDKHLKHIDTSVPPRTRFVANASVRYCGRPAVVIEVVPPQGRPAATGLDVYSVRAMESYVVQFEQGGKVKRAWPPCHELEA